MLLSSYLINKNKESIRKYTSTQKLDPTLQAPTSARTSTVAGIFAIIVLVLLLEVLFFLFAVRTALRCGKCTVRHVVLALLFPIPYVLFGMISGCAWNE